MWSHLVRETQGEGTVEFDFTVRHRVARLAMQADPMALGAQGLKSFLANRSDFRKLLTAKSGFALFALFPQQEDLQRLYLSWLEAAGLSERKLHALTTAMDDIELVEVDFLRLYGIDIKDWFAGLLSSRRVALLVLDLLERPETRIGAKAYGLASPLTKNEMMVATSVAANTEEKRPHALLVTQEQLDARAEQLAKQRRIQARGLSA